MWKSKNYDRKRQRRVIITAVEINVNGKWTRKYKQSEVEVLIMDTNRKLFHLIYGILLMDGGNIHKELGTLADITSAKKLLSCDYSLPVDDGDHAQGTMEIIQRISDKMKSGKL